MGHMQTPGSYGALELVDGQVKGAQDLLGVSPRLGHEQVFSGEVGKPDARCLWVTIILAVAGQPDVRTQVEEWGGRPSWRVR